MNQIEIGNLDAYVEQLMQCKPLKESEVKFLCDRVYRDSVYLNRQEKYFRRRAMSKMSRHL